MLEDKDLLFLNYEDGESITTEEGCRSFASKIIERLKDVALARQMIVRYEDNFVFIMLCNLLIFKLINVAIVSPCGKMAQIPGNPCGRSMSHRQACNDKTLLMVLGPL